MTKAWQRGLAIAVLFVVALAGTFVFAFRAGRQARRLHWENEPIRAWMSIPFIAHAHHVLPSTLFQAIGVQPRERPDRRSIRHIAHDAHRPVPELLQELQRAVDAAHPPGGPVR